MTYLKEAMQLNLNGRILQLVETPGHARHHLVVWDEVSQGLFTGDVFGNGYPQLQTVNGRYLMPVTSPVQLDPPRWHESIDKQLSFNPQRVFLTHYGMLENPQQKAEQLHRDLDAYVDIALAIEPENRFDHLLEQISHYHQKNLQQQGCTLSAQEIAQLIGPDLVLCAQGLEVWLQRREQS